MVNFCICQENSLYLGAYRRNVNNNRVIYGCMYLFLTRNIFGSIKQFFILLGLFIGI